MKKKPIRSWRRFALGLAGIGVLVGIWRWDIQHLYSLPPHTMEAFASITNNIGYGIVAIIVSVVTGKTITDLNSDRISNIIGSVSHGCMAPPVYDTQPPVGPPK